MSKLNRKLLKEMLSRIAAERAKSFSPETKAKIDEGLDRLKVPKSARHGVKLMFSDLFGSQFDLAKAAHDYAKDVSERAMSKRKGRKT